MEITNRKEHWEKVYGTRQPDEVSWFQLYPASSMEFVKAFKLTRDTAIIDVGGGDSRFADSLLEAGFTDITVLDISAKAIARAQARLGKKAELVKWIVSDILDFKPGRLYGFWHDRAAFHFLNQEEHANAYVRIAEQGIAPGGFLVLGTFSDEGPEKCSGLEVQQYSEKSMSYKFEGGFERIRCKTEAHQTPFATTQQFLFCSFRKK
jgi:SAM-dependent methyltransferase